MAGGCGCAIVISTQPTRATTDRATNTTTSKPNWPLTGQVDRKARKRPTADTYSIAGVAVECPVISTDGPCWGGRCGRDPARCNAEIPWRRSSTIARGRCAPVVPVPGHCLPACQLPKHAPDDAPAGRRPLARGWAGLLVPRLPPCPGNHTTIKVPRRNGAALINPMPRAPVLRRFGRRLQQGRPGSPLSSEPAPPHKDNEEAADGEEKGLALATATTGVSANQHASPAQNSRM